MIEIVSDKTSINFASILIFGGSKLNQHDEVKSCFFSIIIHSQHLTVSYCMSPVPRLNPHYRQTVTVFGSRCGQYPADGMLLLDLHNSSHHTQPHSIIVKYMKYL